MFTIHFGGFPPIFGTPPMTFVRGQHSPHPPCRPPKQKNPPKRLPQKVGPWPLEAVMALSMRSAKPWGNFTDAKERKNFPWFFSMASALNVAQHGTGRVFLEDLDTLHD